MMKLRFRPAQDLELEVEVGTDKAAFEAIVHLSEVFGETQCGCCQSRDVKFEVREFSGNKYYKMFCRSCRATFDFGQYKEGNELFAKKWDKENKCYFPNGGWAVWSKDGEQSTTHQHKPVAPVKPLSGEPELRGYRERVKNFLLGHHTVDELNRFYSDQYPLCPLNERKGLFSRFDDYASKAGWGYSQAENKWEETPF